MPAAIANRIPAERNGGIEPRPILIASHVDPQMKETATIPTQRALPVTRGPSSADASMRSQRR